MMRRALDRLFPVVCVGACVRGRCQVDYREFLTGLSKLSNDGSDRLQLLFEIYDSGTFVGLGVCTTCTPFVVFPLHVEPCL